MKTLFKLILISLIVLFSSSIKAQDESNDATMEETLNFIKKYSSKIESIEVHDRSSEYDSEKFTFDEITFTEDKLYISLIFDDDDRLRYEKDCDNFYTEEDYSRCFVNQHVTRISIPLYKIRDISDDRDKSIYTVEDDIYISGPKEIFFCNSYGITQKRKTIQRSRSIPIKKITIHYTYNEDLTPRINKAYQHLEYLAIKKRKENIEAERKASGDKF